MAEFDPGALIDPESEIPPVDDHATGPLDTWLLKFDASSLDVLKLNDSVVLADAGVATTSPATSTAVIEMAFQGFMLTALPPATRRLCIGCLSKQLLIPPTIIAQTVEGSSGSHDDEIPLEVGLSRWPPGAG